VLERPQEVPKRQDTHTCHSLAVQRVISAIRGRLDENISLSEMAGVAYMSRYHFNRTFRQITGLPPRRFLSKLRVEAATRMLLNTNSSITEICLDVGYTSLGTFIRRFSRILGISPTRLRSLRESSAHDVLRTVKTGSEIRPGVERSSVYGRIECPPSFAGAIFVGLFSTPIPEGSPAACAILVRPGEFLIPGVRSGRYHVFALGLPWPDTLDGFFRYESALRGGGQRISIQNEKVKCDSIALREAVPTDPPVLLNLPLLLDRKRDQHRVA
jgi:AraC family transcriptional regulator